MGFKDILKRNGDSLVTIRRVEAKYDPLGFIAKRISVSRITLEGPVFHIFRSQEGFWNVEQLFRTPYARDAVKGGAVFLEHVDIGTALSRSPFLQRRRTSLLFILRCSPEALSLLDIEP
jgi:hypothetical protein